MIFPIMWIATSLSGDAELAHPTCLCEAGPRACDPHSAFDRDIIRVCPPSASVADVLTLARPQGRRWRVVAPTWLVEGEDGGVAWPMSVAVDAVADSRVVSWSVPDRETAVGLDARGVEAERWEVGRSAAWCSFSLSEGHLLLRAGATGTQPGLRPCASTADRRVVVQVRQTRFPVSGFQSVQRP